jgi:hypothetical protein
VWFLLGHDENCAAKGLRAPWKNQMMCVIIFPQGEIQHGEFDPGSELTLAARLKHASRAVRSQLSGDREREQSIISHLSSDSGERVSNT